MYFTVNFSSRMTGRNILIISRQFWLVSVLLAYIVLAACASAEPVRIDAETEATFMDSYKAMENSLNQPDRIKLYTAILRIGMQGIGSAEESRQKYPNGLRLVDVKERIDGLSYEQILELAEQSDVQTVPLP